MPRFLVFGDVVDEVVVLPERGIRTDTDTPASIAQRPGGAAANTAAWLGVQGLEVDFVGRVGAADAERHRYLLESSGVRAMLFADQVNATGSVVSLVRGGHRSMLVDPGANRLLGPDAIGEDALRGVTVLHFTGYSLFGGRRLEQVPGLIQRAHVRGARVSLAVGSSGLLHDQGPARVLDAVSGVDLLFAELADGALLTGRSAPLEILSALGERFPLVVLRVGAEGHLVLERDAAAVAVPAAEGELVEPSGAQEAFAAGFIALWSGGASVEAAVGHGALLAARAESTAGGRPQL